MLDYEYGINDSIHQWDEYSQELKVALLEDGDDLINMILEEYQKHISSGRAPILFMFPHFEDYKEGYHFDISHLEYFIISQCLDPEHYNQKLPYDASHSLNEYISYLDNHHPYIEITEKYITRVIERKTYQLLAKLCMENYQIIAIYYEMYRTSKDHPHRLKERKRY